MATHPTTFLTPEQYLEIERKAEFKSEYYQGEMFAMGGAREGHCVRWLLTTVNRMEDSIDLQSVGAHLTLADLYEKVDFTAPAV